MRYSVVDAEGVQVGPEVRGPQGAFKPLADQRGWNVARGDNPNGTRGDGSDYDENFVVWDATRFLTCRAKLKRVRGTVAADELTLRGTMKLPKGTTLDAAASGMHVLFAPAAGGDPLVDERVEGFVPADDGALVYTGDGSGAVRTLRLETQSRGRVTVEAALAVPAPPDVAVLGFDGEGACARRSVKCKAKKSGKITCR